MLKIKHSKVMNKLFKLRLSRELYRLPNCKNLEIKLELNNFLLQIEIPGTKFKVAFKVLYEKISRCK